MPDFKSSDKVTWTHISHHGRSVSMTLKEGVVLAVSNGIATVKTERGTRYYTILTSNLRHVGAKSTLSEFCDEVFAANREVQP
jgi:hypothetical protein